MVAGFFFAGMKPYVDHQKHKKAAVDVNAVVSRVEVNEDSEGDKDYEIYLNYSYLEKDYKDIYWEEIASEDYVRGQQIVIRIDSENPEYVLKNDVGTRGFIIVILAFAIVVAGVIYESHFPKEEYSFVVISISSPILNDEPFKKYVQISELA